MTMYQNKLAVAIKTAGKVLRESGDKVYLPFGSEYSIFIKNLNSVRALVRVSLDGKSVTDGEDLVVYGNNELNLERFLKKNNMESGNRFKFIERTSKVEAHRGVEAEDGLLRVEFQFEKVTPKPIVVETIYKHYHDHYKTYPPYYDPYWYGRSYFGSCGGGFSGLGSSGVSLGAVNNAALNTVTVNCSAPVGGSVADSASFCDSSAIAMNASSGAQGALGTTITTSGGKLSEGGTKRARAKLTRSVVDTPQAQMFLNQVQVNDAGITVAGSVSDQKFQSAAWFDVDNEKFVIVLKLLGETASGHVVEKPVLVRQKQTCATCGTRNRGQNQFCRECGTALELVGESPKRRVAAKR